jgi:glycine hydroxymethyltransferase
MDLKRVKKLISQNRVKLTILGASCILFPQPIKEISGYIKDSGYLSHCVYDGAHVLGLIAHGQFQDPLREGAEVLFGSTHKSFYGPQGGIILTNSSEHAESLRNFLEIDLETGIGLVDNPHPNRIAALGIALEEMLNDRDYGTRVVQNAKALAHALDELNVPVRFRERGYTESHQILLDTDQNRAREFCYQLEKNGIFIDIGGRIGTSEVTHLGMNSKEMEEIAKYIAEIYHKGSQSDLKGTISKFIRDWNNG